MKKSIRGIGKKFIAKAIKKGCFHIDTAVIKLNEVTQTREIIPIKLLTPGDKILSYDPITKKQFFDSVLLMLRFTDDSKEEE